MTEKTARGIRSPLSSSENNIEHVQTASVANTASSTSNIFNTTEERAMTAEEEEEKTARDRRELRANWETSHEVRYEQHSASNNIAATLQRVEGETTAVEEVRHMPGSTRPLTVLPCPNGWTEWRCVHKTYTRYPPSRQLLYKLIITFSISH
ncbi:unnamed protein product [Caenorhabditis nigoni]